MRERRLSDDLFEEFLQARARGERPDVAALLDRAGESRDELGRLIDATLRVVPAEPPTEEEALLLETSLDPGQPVLLPPTTPWHESPAEATDAPTEVDRPFTGAG